MKVINQVINMIESDVKDKVVLEVACGRGDFSLEASKYALFINCIDLVEFRLNKDILKASNIKFEIMNAIDMDYKNEIFDTVVIYNALMHIDYCRDQVIDESLRVLKKMESYILLVHFHWTSQLLKWFIKISLGMISWELSSYLMEILKE